ncbi:MAG: DNA-binding transcriptional regulator NtrC [Luteibacter sp.]|uniref:response regulator n=1 Tax=Luteibacter sp. TaxID=1886636 RepID=UPI00137F7F57|nr:response regulator [Luteibacter sp.]KAF1007262.1 MAG: DNA-binding transcriptional regulator NtrC [Luteibacter sp.]
MNTFGGFFNGDVTGTTPTRYPRIVGFEVPPLKTKVDVIRDAPIVALLDEAPSIDWIHAFNLQVAGLKGELGLAEVSIEGHRIFFFGSTANGRRLAEAVRTLVAQVSQLIMDSRLDSRAASPRGDMPPVRHDAAPAASLGTVLVVEDDEILRTLACEALNGAGWRTREAADANAALALLATEAVDAVFTDVDMPGGMDGLALADDIFHRWPSIGLVVTSGRYSVDASRVPRGGVFLSKPYQRRQLLAVVDLVTHADSSRS